MSMNVWIKLRKDDGRQRQTQPNKKIKKHKGNVKNYKRKRNKTRNKLGNNW